MMLTLIAALFVVAQPETADETPVAEAAVSAEAQAEEPQTEQASPEETVVETPPDEEIASEEASAENTVAVETPQGHLAHLSAAGEVQIAIVSGNLGMDWLAALLQSYPYFAELEAAHPGLIEEVVEESQPAFIEIYRASLPGYEAELAALFSENLTGSEIAAANDFFDTATGQLILDTQTEINLIGWMSSLTVQEGDPRSDPIVARALQQAQRALADLSREEQLRIGEFYQSGVGRKIGQLQTAIVERARALAERNQTALQGEVMRLAEETVAEYTR
jgi:hypothetical protein